MIRDFCWSVYDRKALVARLRHRDHEAELPPHHRTRSATSCSTARCSTRSSHGYRRRRTGTRRSRRTRIELWTCARSHFSSYETTLVSRHYPKWINDDLENDENSQTETGRAAVINKWRLQKAILFRIKKRKMGLEIESGTPYHISGLNWKIRQMKSYSKLIIPSEVNGKPTFPELYEMEDLEQKKEEMGVTLYSAQFLLRPLAEEDALCPEEWLPEWKKLPDTRWRAIDLRPGRAISPG
ncbi:MAG: hypothetical protein MZV49_24170 [Rhodopseudomonas palustris]|nr:hypothetical protein [Rhodopseudomonas palustris]